MGVADPLFDKLLLEFATVPPLMTWIVPSFARIEHGGDGAMGGEFDEFLADAVRGAGIIVELAGVAPDTVDQEGRAVGQGAQVLWVETQERIGIAMAAIQDEPRRAVQFAKDVGWTPPRLSGGAIIEPNGIPARQQGSNPIEHDAALGRGLL